MMPQEAKTDDEILECFNVISELRQQLIKDEFVSQVRSMQAEGYHLCFIKEENKIAAVAGYRIFTTLYEGKQLYVDDLCTASTERSKGYGEKILNGLKKVAKDVGCKFLNLDSGTQRARAHKFYFKQGLSIDCFHFKEEL
jgi:GNAT superfamily N-acetyltransferase